jgi:hypothetical protein
MPFSVAAKPHELEPETARFYCTALRTLVDSDVPFMIGGAYALHHFTGVARKTKDVDVFVRPEDVAPALAALAQNGCKTEVTATHWLGKAICGELFVDVIFNSGNGVAIVDDDWFTYASRGHVLGVPVLLTPAEEMLWSKAFVMERERFDGADVAHILHACAESMDWHRLVRRFGDHWRVLFGHLVLFGYVYPTERARIPAWVMKDLGARMQRELVHAPQDPRVCQGTLLSRQQYLVDVETWGYEDGRVAGGEMSSAEAMDWSHRDDGDREEEHEHSGDHEDTCEGHLAVGGGR